MTRAPHFHGIVGDVETVKTAMFGPEQHDAHMQSWRWFQFAYGGQHDLYEAEVQARRLRRMSVTIKPMEEAA